MGTLQYERDHYAEAIPAFRALAELAPQASPAWTFLGLCEFETKDYANALEHLSKGHALGAPPWMIRKSHAWRNTIWHCC